MSNTYELHEKIEELLSAKEFKRLKELFLHENPVDIAETLDGFSEKEVSISFRLLSKEQAAEVFVAMESDTQEMLIASFSDKELKEIVDELYLDDTVDIVEEMPANVVARILKSTDMETRRVINEILLYPEDSAGSIMTTEFVSLRPQMTVEEATKRIKRTGVDKETINTCYVIDKGRLIGALSLRTLILSDDDDVIEDIMEPNVISVTTSEDQETVAQMFSKYNFNALPVVDTENRLVGIVTVDDAIDVMEEEATEDIEKMAGMAPSERPYLYTSVLETWKARIPWLLILMLSATFTGLIINHFQIQLAACLVLSSFIPMLSGTGGNSGTQASVAVIRGLALGEIEFSDLWAVIWKEIRVSVLCGVCLAGANFAKMMLVDNLLLHNGVTALVAAVVCLTLVCVVFIAKLVGCSLPILAEKLGFDPAVMASPFITTIVDVLSLLIYFSIASALLGL